MMTHASLHSCPLISSLVIVATFASRDVALAQGDNEGLDLSIELVDPKVLRVCADPRNLPFSNETGEGFENKLAVLFAEKLQKKLGVRRADQNWKRLLNRLIQENQPEINKILLDYGVPLLDENNKPIGAETATKSP